MAYAWPKSAAHGPGNEEIAAPFNIASGWWWCKRWGMKAVLLALLAVVPPGMDATESLKPLHGVSGTFSVVVVDPKTGVCGAAVASKYPAVGKVVAYARADVGAFCTQHWHNPKWGENALDLRRCWECY